MARSHGPFRRACSMCGDTFLAKSKSDIGCCVECTEEIHQHKLELRQKQDEFQSLSERVDVMHEKLTRLWHRIDGRVGRLKQLGARWTAATKVSEREVIERRERNVSKVLARLNDKCDACNEATKPHELRLSTLEKDVENLKKIVGEFPND